MMSGIEIKCPFCRFAVLGSAFLEGNLPCRSCPQCHGHWVRGEQYDSWLAEPVESEGEDEARHATLTPGFDSPAAKLCPECGRFLRRAKVGHGLNFHLDRCGQCGGFWLDRLEWEALRGAGIDTQVQLIFSRAWQAEINRREHERNLEQILIEKLGPADFAEIRRIKAWLDGHPRRNELCAYLLNR